MLRAIHLFACLMCLLGLTPGSSNEAKANACGDEVLARGVGALAGCTKLELTHKALGAKGVQALATLLETNVVMTELHLFGNGIGVEGTRILATALEENTAIASLFIVGNSVGDDGAKALAAMLEKNTAISSLYLGSNQIGDEGARALAAALKKRNNGLTLLDLSVNNIGDKGTRALAETLEGNQKLRELYLAANSIRDEGARALAEMLYFYKGSALSRLYLAGNSIAEDGALALADALEQNENIVTLDIVANPIGVEDKSRIYIVFATLDEAGLKKRKARVAQARESRNDLSQLLAGVDGAEEALPKAVGWLHRSRFDSMADVLAAGRANELVAAFGLEAAPTAVLRSNIAQRVRNAENNEL
jgi:Ran GTPase-activating protein (RanGAP) involved in mRNA processing and transport